MVVFTPNCKSKLFRNLKLSLQELEKLASRKLKINAKETMKVAEKLYTNGLISYPRTETNMFVKEIDLPKIVENQIHDPNWGGRYMYRFFSSPEHEVLRVSYYDHSPSVSVCRLSVCHPFTCSCLHTSIYNVIRSHVLVYTLASTNINQ